MGYHSGEALTGAVGAESPLSLTQRELIEGGAMSRYASLFQPLEIKKLRVRNRFLSTSHSPGYAVGGVVGERYIRYQAEKAKGGVGLAQFGGATAVSPENSCYYGQIDGSTDAVVPQYRRMAAAIHQHGAA
jgi:2,4-dienoyl-CoA reductase-like NADH-dependent reductase (Old Yellow Enzyme family)